MSGVLHCCEMSCGEPADFEITGRTGHPEDYTHACTAHVGELLTDGFDLPLRAPGFTVTPLAQTGGV